MTDIIPLKVTSIKVVEHELNITIQNASRHFEAFMTDRSIVDQLVESRTYLSEIAGILKMLQIPGASELASEMLKLVDVLIERPERANDFTLSALSHAFVAIPCYIEYVVDTAKAMPVLTLEFVNELKAALREPLILESELARYTPPTQIKLIASGSQKDAELKSLISRQRQMYQIGLIGLIREANIELKMQLMHRAMLRLAEAVGDAEIRTQWRLGEAVLEAMLCGDLDLGFTRKRTLALLDAELRNFEQAPDSTNILASERLLKELVYLVNLSACTHAASKEVFTTLSLSRLPISDREIQREQSIMQGPNADTIITMVKALREELAQSREILEIAAQDTSSNADFNILVSLFQRTSDILSVVGLKSPGQILAKMAQSVQAWVDGAAFDRDNLLEIADGLLYVESTLSNLGRLDLNFKDLQDDDESKLKLMAKSQLGEAEAIVIKEAQAGIAMAKKDINSFIESNFDMIHISSVVENLASVKGAITVLELKQAAAVIASCIKFVASIIAEGINEEKAQSVLETMADALIALEYYLSEVELHGDAHPHVLAVAEQSLTALGFPVTK